MTWPWKRLKRKIAVEHGSTLIELMAVTVMAALALGVSIPVMGNIMSDVKRRAAVHALVDEIQLTKMKAVNENATATLTIDSTNKTYQITGQPLRYIDAKVNFSGTPPSSLVFDSRGRLTSGATQTIALQGTNGTVTTITVNPAGRISTN